MLLCNVPLKIASLVYNKFVDKPSQAQFDGWTNLPYQIVTSGSLVACNL
jgi:hypothetical protein